MNTFNKKLGELETKINTLENKIIDIKTEVDSTLNQNNTNNTTIKQASMETKNITVWIKKQKSVI